MATTQVEDGGTDVQEYERYTPFEDSYAFEPELSGRPEFAYAPSTFTPFVAEYAGVDGATTPEALELRELLDELYEHEFDELLGELAEEAWNAAADRAGQFGETTGFATAEQFLQQWARPVREEAEAMVDRMAAAASEYDLASMSETEVDALFERLEPRGTGLEPYFENFLGGLAKKFKSIAKKAIDVAKKGLTMIPGISGLIQKLKALVGPLVQRVLKLALDRLPPGLRPVARQLAQRILGGGAIAGEATSDEGAPSGPDPGALQRQFDLDAAALMFAGPTEQEVLVGEAMFESERDGGAAVADLHEARERFVDELDRGVDPQQALENFIPAVMAVLPVARTVIGVIGRPKVVSFLAGFIAQLVGKYVPEAPAKQLSQAIADTGLRMLSLEAPSPAAISALAPSAIVGAVEDTVRRVAELDETTLDHELLLEAAVAHAFQDAAAENFPPDLLLPELHEATAGGAWVAMPLGNARKLYKKYTRIFDVQVTPQIAASLRTFGGTTLDAFLRDQLGVTGPVQARVHVYQAMHGTSPARIARHESGIGGLGTAAKSAWSQLHPLTREAAAALLQEPKLGRTVAGRYISTRRLLAVGQRLYYLELPGARSAAASARRSSEVNVKLDFPKDEFRVFAYLGEADAQALAAKLRSRDLPAALLAAKRIYEAGVTAALGGEIQRHVKIQSEAQPQDEFVGQALERVPAIVRKQLARKISAWVGRAIADYVSARAGEFTAAAEDPADGVTLVVTIVNPPGAPAVRRALTGDVAGAVASGDSLFKGEPKLAVQTVPGFRFD
jgi:hypothetical protein